MKKRTEIEKLQKNFDKYMKENNYNYSLSINDCEDSDG